MKPLATRLPSLVSQLDTKLLFALCALVIGGWLSRFGWLFNLCSHFAVQYFYLLLVAAVYFALRRRALPTILAAVLACGEWMLVSPYLNAAPAVEAPSSAKVPFKILQMNVLFCNHDFADATKMIASVQPDIITMEEYNDPWGKGLDAAGGVSEYKYRKIVVNGNKSTEIALYSKHPFLKEDVIGGTNSVPPTIRADIALDGVPVTILHMHPRLPATPGFVESQWKQFHLVASHKKEFAPHAVLVGDLNTTPFAAPFQTLVSELGFYDTRPGHGLQPTWPTFVAPLRIPIDHVLATRNIECRSFVRGPAFGSDHFPVIVTLDCVR